MPVNIPTSIALVLPALSHALERTLSGQPLPPKTSWERVHTRGQEHLRVTLGRHALELPKTLACSFRELAPESRALVFRILPKALVACFVASWSDHEAGLGLSPGHFAMGRWDKEHGIRLQRLTRLCGLNPHKPTHLTRMRHCLQLLEALTLRVGESLVCTGLLRADQPTMLRGSQIDQGQHRGGTWYVGALAPELLHLRSTRFVQLHAHTLSLKPRTFNVWLALLAQRHVRVQDGMLPNTLTLFVERTIRDGALSQTSVRGDARERVYLTQALQELQDASWVRSYEWREEGARVHIALNPPNLSHSSSPSSEPVAESEPNPPNLSQPDSTRRSKTQDSEDSKTPVRALSKRSGRSGGDPGRAPTAPKKKSRSTDRKTRRKPKRSIKT